MSVALTYYNMVAAGASNNLLANAALTSGSGPQVAAISAGNPLDFGNDQANTWKAKCFLMGFTGGTVSTIDFYLFDYIADVAGVSNAETYFDGTDWNFRYRISPTYIDPATFTPTNILGSPWATLSHNSASPTNLASAIIALNPGNDGTTNLLVNSTNLSGVKFANAYLYVAILPEANALDGEHLNWSFKTEFVSP